MRILKFAVIPVLVGAVVLCVSSCTLLGLEGDDGSGGGGGSCGETYNEPSGSHDTPATAVDFGMVCSPGCRVTIYGYVDSYDEDVYAADSGTCSGLRVQMAWSPVGDLDVNVYAPDGSYEGYFEGDNDAGTLDGMLSFAPGSGKGYLGVESYDGTAANYTLVLTGQ